MDILFDQNLDHILAEIFIRYVIYHFSILYLSLFLLLLYFYPYFFLLVSLSLLPSLFYALFISLYLFNSFYLSPSSPSLSLISDPLYCFSIFFNCYLTLLLSLFLFLFFKKKKFQFQYCLRALSSLFQFYKIISTAKTNKIKLSHRGRKS